MLAIRWYDPFSRLQAGTAKAVLAQLETIISPTDFVAGNNPTIVRETLSPGRAQNSRPRVRTQCAPDRAEER